MKNTVFNDSKHILPVILIGIWIMAAVIVNPIGDFPLNDDFSFGRSVFNLSERGVLEFDSWLDMSLITQVLWGASFTSVFGFSFTVLRLSNLLLALVAILGCYFLCIDLGQNKKTAFLAALSIGFSPIFFSLSFTFMSDVPFFAFCVLSLLFYNKSFLSGNLKWVFWGTFFAIAATFIRQLGFMLPVAFAVTWLLKGLSAHPLRKIGIDSNGLRHPAPPAPKGEHPPTSPTSKSGMWLAGGGADRSLLKNLLTAIIPLAVTTLLYLFYMDWFKASQGLPESFGTFSKLFVRLGREGFWWTCFYRIGMLAAYIGLFLLPFNLNNQKLIFWKKNWFVEMKFSRGQRISFFILLAVFLASLIPAFGKIIWGNIFYNFGLGPKLLKDGQYFINTFPKLSNWGITIVRIVFIFGGISLIFKLLPSFFIKIKKANKYYLPAIFSLVNIILYGGFLMLDVKFFDRYFFQLLPFVLVLVLPHFNLKKQLNNTQKTTSRFTFTKLLKFSKRGLNNKIKPIAYIALILIATFSITATHDYLSWNRARWKALDYLTKEKNITPNHIDGGFEFNGWHRPVKERSFGTSKSWWWVDKEDYIITFGKLKGFKKENAFPFVRYLPPGVDSVFVLKKRW